MTSLQNKKTDTIIRVVDALSSPESYGTVYHRTNHDIPMPSVAVLSECMELLRGILFPGYFGPSDLRPETMRFHIGASLDRVVQLLTEQVKRGFCYACSYQDVPMPCGDCDVRAVRLTDEFIATLPRIRELLSSDVEAAYEGDPAALRKGETIFCYPSLRAMANHRVAHELFSLEVPLIPRIISEIAHSATGIDIHPGATIGPRFFMDHGTGIVIGETSIIGENVRIYQGVTLGAKSFSFGADGNPIKGIARHPVVENDVIIYSGATILGRVIIGAGSVIGGNVWLTRSVPSGTKVLQGKTLEMKFEGGGGI
jgi:serine O-acetyltransferase